MFDALFDVIEGKRTAARRAAVVFVKREERLVKGTRAMYRAPICPSTRHQDQGAAAAVPALGRPSGGSDP